MQIRELDLKELQSVYDVLKKLYTQMSYKEFEDTIYDMRYMDYKMLGIFENDTLISYAGVCILTTLKDKRHLKVYEFKTDEKYDKNKYDKIMKEYLNDFAKVAMCVKVVF